MDRVSAKLIDCSRIKKNKTGNDNALTSSQVLNCWANLMDKTGKAMKRNRGTLYDGQAHSIRSSRGVRALNHFGGSARIFIF